MNNNFRYRRLRLFLLSLLIGLSSFQIVQATQATSIENDWSQIDQLIKNQKPKAAIAKIDDLLKTVTLKKDNKKWRQVLLLGTSLRFRSGQYEGAIDYLKSQTWPQDRDSQLLKNLHLAQLLVGYVGRYQWEIQQREKIALSSQTSSGKSVPLKKKTQKQLLAEINRAFYGAYQLARNNPNPNEPIESLGAMSLSSLKNVFLKGDYPKDVRGGVYDTVAYLWVDFLANNSLWSASQSNQYAGMSLKQLLSYPKGVNLGNIDHHPLSRAVKILSDVDSFQRSQKRNEAALEAFRVKIDILKQYRNYQSQHNISKTDRQLLINALRSRIDQSTHLAWSNRLRASLAELISEGDEADVKIKAMAVLKQCVEKFKNHRATKSCRYQMEQIQKPEMSLLSMKSDGFGKRSLQLTHKNIDSIYLRAWKVSLRDAMKSNHHQLIRQLLAGKGNKPNTQWQVTLPATKDYKRHISYITPPMKQTGYWLIAASYHPNFKLDDAKNPIVSTRLNLTRLAVDTRNNGKTFDITAYLGDSGQIAGQVQAEIWQTHHKSPARIAVKQTSRDGRASFVFDRKKAWHNLKLVVKHGNDFVVLDNLSKAYIPHQNKHRKSALIFTDRAIYRPEQKIKWKVVAYTGNKASGKYKVSMHHDGWVKLLDSNNKQVELIKVKTNQYGSAAGEFTAKAGLKLGQWRLESSWGSSQYIKVEEYKRPTFNAKIEKSKAELRLNKPVKLTGSAKYYFGQAVTGGKVKWRIERSVSLIQPYWRSHYYSPYTNAETIKSGVTQLDDKGKFVLQFNPKTKGLSRDQQHDPQKKNYRFKVIAEITDTGGETRTATRTFSIGEISIQATINTDKAYTTAGKPYQMEINRHDLNGTSRAGVARWRLNRVQQPDRTLLASELPLDLFNKDKKNPSPFATKGDKLVPRWQSLPEFPIYTKDWKDAGLIAQGNLKHDDEGLAKLNLKALPAGVYRFHYSTKDRWGKEFTLQKMLLVGGDSAAPLAAQIKVPLLLEAESSSVEVGEKIRFLAGSGFVQSPVLLEVYQGEELLRRTIQRGGIKQIEYPVSEQNRGSLTFVLSMIKDYQFIQKKQEITVPWSNKNIEVSFSTFRDKLRPGQKETWKVSVKDTKGNPLGKGAAEVLASMFDKSLEFFGQHNPPSTDGLYQTRNLFNIRQYSSLGVSHGLYAQQYYDKENNAYPQPYQAIRMGLINGHGGRHYRGGRFRNYSGQMAESAVMMHAPSAAPAPTSSGSVDVHALQRKLKSKDYYQEVVGDNASSASDDGKLSQNPHQALHQVKDDAFDLHAVTTRKNFNETAFFLPHLVLEENGSVAFEFEVPESLTQWKVWVTAVTKDLRLGSATKFANTSKELMVRPYLPRFLRTGDQADIEVMVNNSGKKPLSGMLDFDVIDPDTKKPISANFKLGNSPRKFTVAAGQSSRLRFSLNVPRDLGLVAIRARASASNGDAKFADGEQRPLPILPSRVHLSQSRFVALSGNQQGNHSRKLHFSELAHNNDATRINDSLVVTVDGQLFYSTLKALPYLTEYPYECTEQTMNRFLSTSIINSVYAKHPAIASMAKKMSQRKTQFEQWTNVDKDPNRKMLLEETPWLNAAQGGLQEEDKLIRLLDPKIAHQQVQSSLNKLAKAQTTSGGFPWWQGGRASPYMTAYLLHGFSRAIEFKVNVPKKRIQRAWKYLHQHYKKDLKKNKDIQTITLINYVLSAYPDNSWNGGVFNANDRKAMLDLSFKNWRQLPPLLKTYLALTLKRAGRVQDAKLLFDSVMDAATTDKDLGTYFAAEDRSWLWYNDTVDTHAFILRAMMELDANDSRRHGLVQWLMLNKKLNHWKSTRATAESIYALVYYLKQEDQLGKDERATIKVGNHLSKQLLFKADEYTGYKNQLVVKADKITPDMASINVTNHSKSLMFASATWHFSTEKLPKTAQGDFFNVTRHFYKRVLKGKQYILQPLAEGAEISVGDQLEVQLSLRSKHNAEFVHLRAPRGAGFEPESNISAYKWQTGLGYFEEIRDSGANYFFERLPAGEYSFKYRLRATTAGQFRVAPASVQSIYAPEFNAYSSGKRLRIKGQR